MPKPARTLDISLRVTTDRSTDAALVTRCLGGDAVAERELYDRHVDRIYRLAFRMCGDGDGAADYVQETFIRAFDRLPQFRGESSIGTWLGAIVISVVLNGERRTRRLDLKRAELHDGIPSPATPRAPHDLRRTLFDAIERLSPKLRPVFVMHDIEGYTHDEIATILDIPSGTSRARLSDARARLRIALASFAGDLIA